MQMIDVRLILMSKAENKIITLMYCLDEDSLLTFILIHVNINIIK